MWIAKKIDKYGVFFYKKIGSGAESKMKANINEVLAQKLHKPVRTKNFKRSKAYASFKDIIGVADLAQNGIIIL